MKIKEIIKENKNIYNLYNYLKKPEYRKWLDLYNSDNILIYQQLGKLKTEKPVYYMKFNNEAWGFFACWKFMIRGLAYAEYYNLIPVVLWGDNNPYYDAGRGKINNPYEYYFKPISNHSFIDAENAERVVISRDYVDITREFENDTYENSINMIKIYSKYNKKYVVLREEIKNKIDKECSKLLNGKKTIAIHIRGVEWGKVANHPEAPNLISYYKCLDSAIAQCGFVQIFLATDSEDTLVEMKKKYGDMVVTYDDVLRSRSGSTTLMIFDNTIKRKDHHFLLGYEVLRDMLTMSYCEGLIAGYSNVSFAAQVFKDNENLSYEYVNILQPKIVKRGISSKKVVEMSKKKNR